MTKKMLVDATHSEETRVAVVDGFKLVEYDYESKSRKPLKGSIFLAKVTRVEPSLQAAFVNFGGNRHGFLPFSEIHPDYFRIPIADREALLAEQQAAIEADEAADAEEEAMERSQQQQQQPDGEAQDRVAGDVIEDVSSEDYVIEEIGGQHQMVDAEENAASETETDGDLSAGHEFPVARDDRNFVEADNMDNAGASQEDSINDREGEEGAFDSGAAPGHESGEESGEPSESGEEQAEGGDGESENGQRRRFHGRRRGRHGGGGREGGPHGGRRRMGYNSRRPESRTEERHSQEDRFRYNLRRKYKIQEVIKRGQIMLIQVSKEERGNKGAAVSTYLSLPGRYCVLMPNSPRGGGVSRKIANYQDRARMRELLKDLTVPQGMSVILRTAGVSRTKAEVKRDLDYLMKLWDTIRELTLQSTAPAMVYEEADLIKRAVRDLYGRDIEEVIVSGDEGFKTARNFMKMMIPSHVKKVIEYADQDKPLFTKHRVEEQIAEIGETRVNLPSGGYLIINPTEALISVDVNSGKATKERHIEETALKTNLEAASELARQLRLRDLGGLIVIDFIDMEDRRNNAKVERRMREALSSDRARLQMGRISSFGLMELSRQRLNPSLTESQFEKCEHCDGLGRVRTCDGASVMVMRGIEDLAAKNSGTQIVAHVSAGVALYILNHKRKHLQSLEDRYGLNNILIRIDENLGASNFRLDSNKISSPSSRRSDELGEEGDATERAFDESADDAASEESASHQRHHDRDHREGFSRDPQSSARGDRDGRRGRRGGRRRHGSGRDDAGGRWQQQGAQAQPFERDGNTLSDAEIDEVNGNVRGPQDDLGEGFAANDDGQQRFGRDTNNRGGPRRRRYRDRNHRDDALNSGPNDRPSRGGRRPERAELSDSAPAAPSKPTPGERPWSPPLAERTAAEPPVQPTVKSFVRSEESAPAVPPRPRDYEKVNEPPSEKKRGWWNRLTE